MKKVITYCRVSTSEQAQDDRFSLATQKRLCKEYAKKEKYKVVKTFEDAGKSATNMNRPALKDMMVYIEEKQDIYAVLVQDTDRIARDTMDHLTIKAFLKKHGAMLISISQPQIDDSAEGEMIDTILASFNTFQSRITARKTKKGMEQRALNGWIPNMSAIGYINVPDKDGKRIVLQDEERAPFVKRAFEMYVTGEYGGEKINDILFSEGFRTRNNKKLQLSKFYYMLENPFYYGDFKWNGKLWEGSHDPIISKETWDFTQRIRRTRTMRRDYERKWKFLLTSFVFCKCGRRFTAEHHFKHSKGNKSSKTFSYYHCTRGRKCEDSRYITTKDLEEQVQEKFKQVQFSEEFYNKLLNKLRERYDNHKNEVSDKIKRLNQLKAETIKKRDKAEELLFSETISEDVYKRRVEGFDKEIGHIEEKIGELGHKKNIHLGEFEEIMEISKNDYETYKKVSFEIKRMYLGFYWHKFIVKDKRIVKATPTPLFEALQKLQKEMKKQEATFVAIPQKTPVKEPLMETTQRGDHSNNTAAFFEQSFINPDKLGG